MNEFSLKDILGEAYDMEFSQYDKPPKHRFSLKHRKNMKRIFALENAEPQFSGKARLFITISVIILSRATLMEDWRSYLREG